MWLFESSSRWKQSSTKEKLLNTSENVFWGFFWPLVSYQATGDAIAILEGGRFHFCESKGANTPLSKSTPKLTRFLL